MKEDDEDSAGAFKTEQEEIAEINAMVMRFQRRVMERFGDLSDAVRDLDDGPKKQRLVDILSYMASKRARKT